MKSTVSLCMIVRNEEANLQACLASAADLVDEIIVVDTGSTDRTREIARTFGAKVFDFAWIDDFAAARNEARSHATSDWIFWLDADDRVDAANRSRLAGVFQHLQQVPAEGNIQFVMACESLATPGQNSSTMSHVRLFPNRSGMRWMGRVHEQIMLPGPGVQYDSRWTDVTIQHVGYADPAVTARKQRRDLRMMQMEHVIRPDDPTPLFYLGRGYVWAGNFVEGHRFLRRCLRRDNIADYNWAPKGFALLGRCLHTLQRTGDALDAFKRGLSLFPSDPELLFYCGGILMDVGRLDEAEALFLRLQSLPQRNFAHWGLEVGIQGERCLFMLGRICHQKGQHQQAEAYYRMASAKNPRFVDALIYLGQLQIIRRRFQEVEIIVQQLKSIPEGRYVGLAVQGIARFAAGNLQQARELAEQATAGDPKSLLGWLLLSDVLATDPAELETSISVHRRILTLAPGYKAIRDRLQKMLQEAQRLAAPAFNRQGVSEESRQFAMAH